MDNNWEHILERDALLSALVVNPNDTEALVDLANLLEDHFADYEGARQHFEQALEIDPYEEEALNNLGLLYQNRFSNYDKARELYETALVIDPADSRVNNNLGKLLEEHFKEYDLAKGHYEKAIDSDPFFTNAYLNLGKLYYRQFPDKQKAKTLFETALDISPDDLETMFHYGSILVDEYEDYQAARELYEKIIELDPIDEVTHMNLGNLLDDHFADPEGAREHYHRAIEIAHKNSMVHFNLGILNKRLKNYEEARKNFAEAIRLKPDYVNALCGLGSLMNYQFNERELSLTYFSRALEIVPGDTEIMCDLADVYESQEAYTEARELFNKVLEIDPNYEEAIISLANLIDDEFPDKESAGILYQKAIEIDGSNPINYFNYGLHLKRSGKYEEARIQYSLAIEKDPEYIDAYCNLASLLAWQFEEFDLSFGYCNKALALNPSTNEIIRFIIPILKKCGQYLVARSQFEKILESEPDNVTALLGLGDLIDDNFPEKELAKSYYHRAIALEPENAKAYFFLGYLHKNQKEYDEARVNFEIAARLDPNYENVLSNLAYLLSDYYKEYARAIVWFEKYLELAPDDINTRLDMGYALENAGRYNDAKKQYEQILSAEPDDYMTHIALAVLHIEGYNEYVKAKNLFLRAIEIEPENCLAYYNMGVVCANVNEYYQSKKHYELALKYDPDYIKALKNLAQLQYSIFKKFDEAIPYYERILAMEPDDNEMRCFLGKALYYCGRYAEAGAQYEIIKQNDPGNLHLYNSLAELVDKPFAGIIRWLNNLWTKVKGMF